MIIQGMIMYTWWSISPNPLTCSKNSKQKYRNKYEKVLKFYDLIMKVDI